MSFARVCIGVVCAAPLLAAAATHTVVIEGMKFQPAELTVQRGDKIVWENRDVVPHTVTAKSAFDSGAVDAGKRWTWTATQAGELPYVCIYHPGMEGKVTVK